jgi:phosphinothricin acetyltransferase
LRYVRAGDADAIAAIYGPVVAGTSISFETVPPDAAEMRRRIEAHGAAHPWIVMAGDDDAAIGYAYASAYRARHAYRFACETTVYVAPAARGRGVGRRLYAALAALLREAGYRRAFAGITLPNDASVALHLAHGFALAGVAGAAGYKFGRWHDVATYAMTLRPLDAPARDPVPVAALDPAFVAAVFSAP